MGARRDYENHESGGFRGPASDRPQFQPQPGAGFPSANGFMRHRLATWRNAVSIVIADNHGQDQIEIRVFNKRANQWQKVLYFATAEADFGDFLDALGEAEEKLKELMAQRQTSIPAGEPREPREDREEAAAAPDAAEAGPGPGWTKK